MPIAAEPCVACEIVAGRHVPVGGTLLVDGAFHVHGVAAPTPVPGWIVVTLARHARCVADLDDGDASRLGRLVAHVQRAQRAALGAETGYAVSFGEVVTHLHVHVIPRFSDTPERLRGPRIFQAGTSDAIADAAQIDALAAVALRLRAV